MPYNVDLSYGARRVLDRYQAHIRSAHATYLRLRDFGNIQNQLWAQLGFQIAPTGTSTGTTDVLITPHPSVVMMSMHDIGLSGGKLRFGARTFCISHTFVLEQMKVRNLSQPDLVWRASDVVGLVLDHRLYEIADIPHEEIAGRSVEWVISANASESSAGAISG